MNNNTDRRNNYPMPEEEMYKLSNIQEFIEKERRHDELDRLNEVRQQKRIWRNITGTCIILNIVFLILALVGYLQNG